MRTRIAWSLLLVMSVALAGCGGDDKTNKTVADATPTVKSPAAKSPPGKTDAGKTDAGKTATAETSGKQPDDGPTTVTAKRPVAKVPEPADNQLDLAYIQPEFGAVVVIHPARLLKAERLQEFLKPEMFQQAMLMADVDPRKIERIEFYTGTPKEVPGGDGSPTADLASTALVIRHGEAFRHEALAKSLELEVQQFPFEAIEGAVAYRIKPPPKEDVPEFVYFFYPNEKTLFVTADANLLVKMATAKETTAPLAKHINETSLEHDVILVGLVAPFADLAQGAAVVPLVLAAGMLDALALSVDVSGTAGLVVDLHAKNDESADALHKMIEEGMAKGQEEFEKSRDDLRNNPLFPPGMGEAAITAIESTIKATALTRKGNRVVVDVRLTPETEKLVKQAIPMIVKMMGPGGEAGPPPGFDGLPPEEE